MGSGHPPAGGAHSAVLPSPRGGGYSSGLDTIRRVSSACGDCPANGSSRPPPAAPATHRSTVPECRLDCRRHVRTIFDVIGVSALRGHGGLARLEAHSSYLNKLTPMPHFPATVPVPETRLGCPCCPSAPRNTHNLPDKYRKSTTPVSRSSFVYPKSKGLQGAGITEAGSEASRSLRSWCSCESCSAAEELDSAGCDPAFLRLRSADERNRKKLDTVHRTTRRHRVRNQHA